MQKLLSEFFHAPANNWQYEYTEWDSEALKTNRGLETANLKKRSQLLGWVSSIVEPYGYQVETLDGKIQIQLADKSMSIEWSEADKLLDVIEAVKTEEGMVKLWEGME